MNQKRTNICFITGSRAEYGLLMPLMKKIKLEKKIKLQIIATCMHLSPEFGLTYREIEKDGFTIDEKIEMLLSSDSTTGIAKSMGLGCIGLADSYARLQPDLIVLLGDRFETFVAASIANVFQIPIAHLHGGELTEGAYDDAFRHSISKMSLLHFTSTEQYKKRVIQLGEAPDRVYNVGAIGLDNIASLPLLSRSTLEKDLSFKFAEKNLLITFHPVTTAVGSAEAQCNELLSALSHCEDTLLIFTKANADNEGRLINAMIDSFVANEPSSRKSFSSLGQLRYLSLMQFIDAVVGNSSSGIIEAPSFKIGTINIGDRQKGRLQGDTIINCHHEKNEIVKAIQKVYTRGFQSTLKNAKNIYGDGKTTGKIVSILKKYSTKKNKPKKFHDIH